MATATYIPEGDNIDYTATKEIGYMEVVPQVSRIGVALEEIAKSETGTVTLTGVLELPAAASLGIADGDAVYWDSTNGVINKTATDNIPAGIAVSAKASAGTTVRVRIG